ncbi:MAG: hypothetical protein ABIO06_03255 [Pseudolysinimonas sp.]
MTQPSPSSLPSENVQRGVIFALIVLPLGVIAWDLLWSFGFVASIVSFGIAYGAARLYRFGSGGRISRPGAIAIAAITIGTLIIAFISGFAVDLVGEYSRITGASIPESLTSPRFWSIVFSAMALPQSLLSLLLAAAFGALGCFSILRAAFRQTAPQPMAGAAPGGAEPTLMMPPASNPAGTPPVPPAPSANGVVLNGEPVPPAPDESHDKK